MTSQSEQLQEERAISEITLLPDGRIYVFGMSQQLLAVFQHLHLGSDTLKDRFAQVQAPEADPEEMLTLQADASGSRSEDHPRAIL